MEKKPFDPLSLEGVHDIHVRLRLHRSSRTEIDLDRWTMPRYTLCGTTAHGSHGLPPGSPILIKIEFSLHISAMVQDFFLVVVES